MNIGVFSYQSLQELTCCLRQFIQPQTTMLKDLKVELPTKRIRTSSLVVKTFMMNQVIPM